MLKSLLPQPLLRQLTQISMMDFLIFVHCLTTIAVFFSFAAIIAGNTLPGDWCVSGVSGAALVFHLVLLVLSFANKKPADLLVACSRAQGLLLRVFDRHYSHRGPWDWQVSMVQLVHSL